MDMRNVTFVGTVRLVGRRWFHPGETTTTVHNWEMYATEDCVAANKADVDAGTYVPVWHRDGVVCVKRENVEIH